MAGRGFWNLFRKNVTEKFQALSEPSGFEDRTSTTITWDDGTKTFTIAPTGSTWTFWIDGSKRTRLTETLVGDGTDFTIAQGNWFFYIDTDYVLKASQSVWDLSTQVPVALLYWDHANSKGILYEERHGMMPWQTHEYLHKTIGTRYEDGLTGTFNDNGTFSMTSGSIWDEDIETTFTTPSTARVFYKDGTANFEFSTAGTSLIHEVSDIIQYNNVNALSDVTNNKYVAYWIVATNATATPIISIMGQREDTTLQDAKDNNNFNDLTLTLPSQEWQILYRVIYQRSGTTQTVEDTLDLRTASQVPGTNYVNSGDDFVRKASADIVYNLFGDYTDKGNSGTTTQDLDLTVSTCYKITATGNHSVTFSGWPASGTMGSVTLIMYDGGDYTITWPAALDTAGGTGFTLTSNGYDIFEFFSVDGGTTIYGFQSAEDIK